MGAAAGSVPDLFQPAALTKELEDLMVADAAQDIFFPAVCTGKNKACGKEKGFAVFHAIVEIAASYFIAPDPLNFEVPSLAK